MANNAIVKQSIVMPAVTGDEALKAWTSYQELKHKIAEESDIQMIQGRKFYKKSYWRKIATFFNLSVEITKEEKEVLGTNMIYSFTCRATAPNGRYAEGTGSCDRMEKGRPNTIHNTRTTAETRAFNRVVSNLVGGGEVSAEEINEVESADPMTTLITEEKDGVVVTKPSNFTKPVCENCGTKTSINVKSYTERHYGKILCFDCQKNYKASQQTAQ